MEISDTLLKIVVEQGLTAPLAALIFLGLYLWERRGRLLDRKEHDAALRQATMDNIDTLRTIIPVVQKMTATLDVALPALMAKIGRSDR